MHKGDLIKELVTYPKFDFLYIPQTWKQSNNFSLLSDSAPTLLALFRSVIYMAMAGLEVIVRSLDLCLFLCLTLVNLYVLCFSCLVQLPLLLPQFPAPLGRTVTS